jgi:DNA (cytosine-5)-methyltransferase 1
MNDIAFGWQNSSQQGASVSEDVTPTLDKSKTPAVKTGMSVRRLTPTECERLQGFPDGYTDIMPNGKPTPDGPRYKALGNSMATNVMEWIGIRIQQVSEIK